MGKFALLMYMIAHVHERVSTKSFVVLIIGNPKSNHLGAQGTFNPGFTLAELALPSVASPIKLIAVRTIQ